jgi:hypothetical protein
MLSNMITNRNNTRIAPEYTMIWIAARKSIPSRAKMVAMAKNTTTNDSTLSTGLRSAMASTANNTAMAAAA